MITRRHLIKLAGAGALLPTPLRAGAPREFPQGFLWGASTAAYQIEGAVAEDGRGPSIWDVFSHTPGKTANGETGDVACDHYHRWREDVELMRAAHFSAYRFSVAWPRVLPDGSGAPNARGLDFYDRLVDTLLKAGVRPFVCLHHWDLPQRLQERGGWHNRDISRWFADYATLVGRRLGDRVKDWAMLNEPSVVAMFGHAVGSHAPGLTGAPSFFRAINNQNRAQGAAIAALRAERGDLRLGTVLSLQPVRPESDADRPAAVRWDAIWNRVCVDPLVKGRYPEAMAADLADIVEPGDLAEIHQRIDFLGINYYSRMVIKADPGSMFGTTWGKGEPGPVTAMGWPIEPDGLYEQLTDLKDHYGNLPVYVTENGAAYDDGIDSAGHIDDPRRVSFLRDHIAAVHRAIAAGCNVCGYFAWSLLDNFEWAYGYSKRFGIVYVDYPTQRRIPKSSYRWLAGVAEANRVI